MRTESWPALRPVSPPSPRPPPSLRPRYLANRSKRHTTHALMSTSHGEPSAESQRPQGPRQRVGWAPDTHTRWGDTPAPSCICTNTHKYTLTLNRHFEPNSFSLTYTHPLTCTQSWSHTHDVLAPGESNAPSKQKGRFFSAVLLEVEGVSTSPVNLKKE